MMENTIRNIPSMPPKPMTQEEKEAQFLQMMQEKRAQFQELMSFYRCALMEVETKFKVLNEDLSFQVDANPIESIHTRIKSPESIRNKMIRRKLPFTISSIEENIMDVAGIRIVCSFESQIYTLADALLSQDDILLIERKDYIAHPKENGYRSLHLIIGIPIFLHNEKKRMKVEVQFRTLAMDLWASAEHKIRYKKDVEISDEDNRSLKECALAAAELDRRLADIYNRVQKQGTEEAQDPGQI